ncbi:MAG: hypothetical protein IH958_06535, partial [Chloroflexi bacterium]|nr:hypothetical protein [Chloroflexota bacterium]
TTGSLPELKRVIVANGNNIAMERTLEEALRVVLGLAEATLPEPIAGEPTPGATATPAPGETPPPTPVPQPTPTPGGDDIDALIQQANDSFERAQQLLQQGDFAGYGQEIERLEELLQRLAELSDLGQ